MDSVMEDTFIYNLLKDIIIPTAGAIAIPLLVWWLSWLFGAGRAEKQKELRYLRDHLNLLLSVCLDGIFKLQSLRLTILQIHETEKQNKILSGDISPITSVYISPIDFGIINVANYSPCIAYYSNYVVDLIDIISAIEIKDFKIEHRNFQIKSIAECTDTVQKLTRLQDFINIELKEYSAFLKSIDDTILKLKSFIQVTKEMEKKIKGLVLESIKYSDSQNELFQEIEKTE